MSITRVFDDALKISWHLNRLSVTTGGELAPVEAEVDDKQRGEGEGDDADGG
jgi:hypothetical protein